MKKSLIILMFSILSMSILTGCGPKMTIMQTNVTDNVINPQTNKCIN